MATNMHVVLGAASDWSRKKFCYLFSTITLPLLLGITTSTALAAASPTAWIESQAQPDGSIVSTTEPASATQATAEALTSLDWALSPTVTSAAENFIFNQSAETTETLARQIDVIVKAGRDATAKVGQLTGLQNIDGGFGTAAGYQSTPLDTAFALEALAATGQKQSTAASTAIQYLLSNQSSDGGFRNNNDEDGSVYVTSRALAVLSRYRIDYSVSSAINGASSFLIGKRQPAGDWTSSWETANALLALVPVGADATVISQASNALQAAELADGSWQESVYVTALAMRALQMAQQIPPPVPSSGAAITGRVLDAVSGFAIVGATVTITGVTSSVTGGDGKFALSGLSAGSYAVSLAANGYTGATVTTTVSSTGTVSLGDIRVTALPNTGFIRGVVTDASSGTPVAGATISVTGAASVSATSDNNGRFELISPPGTVTITVSAAGYQTLSGTGSVVSGGTLLFSPALTATGTQAATTVTLTGTVLDGSTGQPLSGAVVSVDNGSSHWSGSSDANGHFSIGSIDAGNLTISVSLAGYTSSAYSELATGGSISLGNVLLSQQVAPTTVTISGRVIDSETQSPIGGATVAITQTGSSVITGNDGSYKMDGLTLGTFSISVSAPGYVTRTGDITLTQFGTVSLDVPLQSVATSGFKISQIDGISGAYPALAPVNLVAALDNSGTQSRTVVLQAKVLNSAGQVIDQFPAVTIPMGGDPAAAYVKVEPGTEQNEPVAWNTGSNPPGEYRIVVEAIEVSTGQLLAQRAAVVEVASTLRIGGSATFDPPIAQLAAGKPIDVSATISNRGNEPIGPSTVTARVVLQTAGYAPRTDLLDLKSWVSDPSLYGDNALVKADDGGFYVLRQSTSSILKIAQDGTLSAAATSLWAQSIDSDGSGGFYALTGNGILDVDPQGNRSTIAQGVYGNAIKRLPDNSLLVAGNQGIYRRTVDGTVSKLVGVGLATPEGIVAASSGDVFVADSGQNAVVKYSNGALTSFVSRIPSPYGIDTDANDNLYVTSFSSNALYRVTKSGQVSQVANGFGGPYDVKLRSDGAALISNNRTNTIDVVGQDGSVNQLAGPTINGPNSAVYAPDGSLYIANRGTSNIVSMKADGTFHVLASGIIVTDAVLASDGGIDMIANNSGGSVMHMTPQGTTSTLVSGIGSGSYTAIGHASDGTVLLANKNQHRIVKIDGSGALSDYITKTIGTPIAAHQGSSGDYYVVSSEGFISRIDSDNHSTVVASGLSSPYGLAVDGIGNVYTSEKSKNNIVKISPAGAVTRITTPFSSPGAIAVQADGTVLVAPSFGYTIYKLATSGAWSTFATTVRYVAYDMLADQYGNVWIPNYAYNSITHIAPDGTQTVLSLPGNIVRGVNSDGAGGVYVSAHGSILHVDDTGAVRTVSADPAISADQIGAFANTDGTLISVDSAGKLSRLDSQGHFIAAYTSINSPAAISLAGKDLIVVDSGALLDFSDPTALGKLVANGSFNHVQAGSPGTVLLANSSIVERLNLETGSLQTVADGYSDISDISEAADGTIAISEYSANHIAVLDPGVIRDVYGLVRPKGLLIDAAGNVLVANSAPDAIMKVASDGTLSMYAKLSGVSYMQSSTDGSVLAASGINVTKLGPTGAVVATYPAENSFQQNGVAVAPDGTIYAASSSNGDISAVFQGVLKPVAAGFAYPGGIALDREGNAYVADRARGAINRVDMNGELHLKATGVRNVSSIVFGPDDTLYVAYGGGAAVASFDTGGTRRELPLAGLDLGAFSGLAVMPDNTLYLLAPAKSAIYKAALPDLAPPQTGQVVYTGSASIEGLGLDGIATTLDFGSWTPTIAGDYRVDVSIADGLTTGQVSNTLHVGPNAEGSLNVSQSTVLPGDRLVGGQLTVIGANSTSITRIDSSGTSLTAISNTYGRAVTADPQGNIYSADTNRIVKVSPSGQISDFVTGISVGFGLAADSKGNIYAISGSNVLKFTPDGKSSVMVTLPGTATAVAVSYSDRVYATASDNTVYRIDQDGTYHAWSSVGIYSPRGLTVDGFGNFYVLNGNGVIVRISPDGTSTAYLQGAQFEYEGVDLTADCSNNLLFAPTGYQKLGLYGGEETNVFQVVGDTGSVQKALDGQSIDRTLTDIDLIAYDRFGKRMLMWTDGYGGKIFSFPISCGGINAEAHIVARSDVDLSSTDPAPDQVIDHSDGLHEYVWKLNDVDNRGQTINLNLLFHNLTEGEQRPMVSDAFLAYSNSFAPGETVKVPLSIPNVTVSSQMQVAPMLTGDSFGADTQVPISAQVSNGGGTPFDGTVKLSILDGAGNKVADLPPLTVTQLVAMGNYAATWNTGATLIGDYTVRAELFNSAGMQVATGTTPLHIVAETGTSGTPVVTATVMTDHASYGAWSTANLAIRVADNSANAIAGPGTVQVTVTNPSGAVVHSVVLPLVELMPGGYTLLSDAVVLSDAPAGTYSISLVVHDATTGTDLAASSGSFQVVRTAVQALVGSIDVQSPRIYVGDTNVCTETVTNRGAEAVSGITITHKLINLDTGTIAAQASHTTDLAGGAADAVAQGITTDGLPSGGYSCVLSATAGSYTETLAHGSFNVMKPPIRIGSSITLGTHGRLLVLLDDAKAKSVTAGQCDGDADIDLQHAYGKTITAGATVDVELLDANGSLLDSESARLLADQAEVNQNPGNQGLDLDIAQLTGSTLEIKVAAAAGAKGCTKATVQARISLWENDALLPVAANDETTQGGLLLQSIPINSVATTSGPNDQAANQPSVDAQRAYLEAALKSAGWNYTIVTDADAFARELRSGGYMAYALLSSDVKLDEQVQKELREAVNRGAGLLVANAHDERNNVLDDELGVKFDGKQPSYDGVAFAAPSLDLTGQQNFAVGTSVLAIKNAGATAIANYFPAPAPQANSCGSAAQGQGKGQNQSQASNGNCDNSNNATADAASLAAVTTSSYGRGRTVFAGFDLLTQATADGDNTLFDKLLMAALEEIQPKPLPLEANSVVPVRIDLTNEGMAVDTRVAVTPPPGGSVFAADNGVLDGSGGASWSFHLDVQAQQSLLAWLRLPPTPGDTAVNALIQTLSSNGAYTDYGTLNLPLSVTDSPLAQVKTTVDAMVQDPHYSNVINGVDLAEADLAAGNTARALQRLVNVSDALIRIDDSQSTAIRLQLDAAICDVAYRLWKAQQ